MAVTKTQRSKSVTERATGKVKGKGRPTARKERMQLELREKIQGVKIINQLQGHIEGKVKLEATQVTAALGLLKKVVPDLAAVQLDVTGEVKNVVAMPEVPKTAEEWMERYSPAGPVIDLEPDDA